MAKALPQVYEPLTIYQLNIILKLLFSYIPVHGRGTFKGVASYDTVTFGADMGNNYDLSVIQIGTPSATLGTISWVRIDNFSAKVYNSGADAASIYSWWVIR